MSKGCTWCGRRVPGVVNGLCLRCHGHGCPTCGSPVRATTTSCPTCSPTTTHNPNLCPRCTTPITTPGLWLVPTTPPGLWVDACSPECGYNLYWTAVGRNQSLDTHYDTHLRTTRTQPLQAPPLPQQM